MRFEHQDHDPMWHEISRVGTATGETSITERCVTCGQPRHRLTDRDND